jgi:hypothetical protein
MNSIRNNSTQYVTAEQTVKPTVQISNSSTTDNPSISVRISQELVQKVREEWDDSNVVHMHFTLYVPGSGVAAKGFDISGSFNYIGNRFAYSPIYTLSSPDISFDTSYQLNAYVRYRDGIIISSDMYTINAFSNPAPPVSEETLSDIYDYIRNNIYTANFSYIFTYYQTSQAYIRSSDQVASRLAAANNLLISRGVISEATTYSNVIAQLYNLINSDNSSAAINDSYFPYNGDGHLYHLLLWMLVDSGANSSTILNIKKYVAGQTVVTDFNLSNNQEILAGQFSDDPTKKFHKIIRLNRYWNTPDFPAQLSRIDAGAFNSSSSCKIVMKEKIFNAPSSLTSFDVDGVGNIVLDSVHFPHILNKKADPNNNGTFYSDKLFLIGHALMPGAPNYMSFNKKIVDMCDNHVFNLSGDAIYDLLGVPQFQFQNILSNISNRGDYTYDWQSGIMYNAANVATYRAIHTFYTPVAVGGFDDIQRYAPAAVFDTNLNTWNYTEASGADYDNWYVSYIPPNYFRNSAITEAIVSWKNTATPLLGVPPLRDTIYIGANAFPPTCTLSVPAPYLDNALLGFKDASLPGGSVSDIINTYVSPSSAITVKENGGLITLQSTVNTLPMNYFTRMNLTYININIDRPLLRIPPGSLPVGCNVMRNGISGTVLPGSFGQPYSQGMGPSVYTQELANMSTDLVMYSGIVYKNYDVDGSCEILWIIDFSGKDITFPPVPLTVYDYWGVGCKDMYIPNVPFKCGVSMFLLLAGKVYYSGISYKLFNPSGSTLTYDRVPTMADADKLSGTVRILDTGASGSYYIKNLPDVFKTYTGISLLVLPLFMNIDINSMIDGQVFECDGITWNNNKTLGYPVLVTLPAAKQHVLCLPYVKFYDSIFENASNIISVSNAAGYTIAKAVGKKAFKNCSSLVNFNYFVGDIDDEAFYGTTSLKSLVFDASLSRIGSRAFYGSGIESIIIDVASTLTLTDSTFEGASNLKALTIKNISSTFSTAVFAGLTSLKTLTLQFLDTAMATIDTLNAPNIETVIITGQVIAVGSSIFQGCSKLKSVTINGCLSFLSTLSDSMFAGTQDSLEYLYVNFVGDSVINCQFNNFTKLKEVRFMGSGKATLHASPFTGCSALHTYVNTLLIDSNMSNDAFVGCAALKELSLTFKNNSTKKTVSSAFAGLTALERFAITGPCALTSNTILPNSTQLKYIEINGELAGSITATGMTSVETLIVNYSSDISAEIVDFAFKDNSVLETVTILGGLKRIGKGAFYNCSALTSISLPAGEEIHDYAFARSGITGEITIPATVTLLGDSYFLLCPNITKITYLCPVLFFNDPTQFTTRAWDIMNTPEYTTLDICGTSKLRIGDTMSSFSYTNLLTNTSASLSTTQLQKSIVKAKHAERLAALRACLLCLHEFHNTLSASLPNETNQSNAEALVNNIGTIEVLIRDIAGVTANAAVYNKIDIAEDLSAHIVGSGSPVTYAFKSMYTTITTAHNGTESANLAIASLNTAILADDAIFGPAHDTISASDLPLYNISPAINTLPTRFSVTLPSDQIEKIIGLNTIETVDGVTYFNVSESNASILLQDNTTIAVDGTIKINLNTHLNPQMASILSYLWANQESTDNDTSVDFVFSGFVTNILNMSRQSTNSIIITSDTVVLYDCSMKYLKNSYVSITTGTLKIYDNAFGMWENSQLRINASVDVIVGKDIFLGSKYVMVYCNKPMINKPVIKLVNMSGKTLHDISDIVHTECGFEIADTRHMKITTYIPSGPQSTGRGYPVISFQRLSTLTHYTLVGQPEDWFWCNRINPQTRGTISALPSDFSAGSHKYLYLPESYSYDAEGAVQPEEYFGLTHSFAPNEFSFNGKKWSRATSKNSGSGVLVRALYTNNQPYADNARQEVNGIKLLKNIAIEIAISIAFTAISAVIPMAAPAIMSAWIARTINVVRAVGLTAAEMAASEFATRTIVISRSGSTRVIFGVVKARGKTFVRGSITRETGELLGSFSLTQSSKKITSATVRTSSGLIDSPSGIEIIAREVDAVYAQAVQKLNSPSAIVQKVSRSKAPVTGNTSTITTVKFTPIKQQAVSSTVEKIVARKAQVISKTAVLPNASRLEIVETVVTPLKKVIPTTTANSLRKSLATQSFKAVDTVKDVLLNYAMDLVINEFINNLGSYMLEPICAGNTPKYIRNLLRALALTKSASGAARSIETMDTVTVDILTFAAKLLSYDTSSVSDMISLLNAVKNTNSTYNFSNETLSELAAYNSIVYQDTADTSIQGNITLEDDILIAARKCVEMRTPPFSTPQSMPTQYTEAPADRLQHYILRGTVYVHPPEVSEKYSGTELPTGTYTNPCRVMTVANPLNARMEYLWRSTFCNVPKSASSPDTESFGNNTILAVNPQMDEVYLGNRSVSYVELSSNEEPNTVFCGTTNISLNVPDGTTAIPDYGFCSTDGTDGNMPFTINNLVLPSTLQTIGKRAFYRTSMNSCVIPSGIQAIAEEAFRNSGLTNVVFLESYNTLSNLTNVSVALNSGSKLAASNEKSLTLTNVVASYAAQGGVNVTATPTQFMALNNVSLFSVTKVASVLVTGVYNSITEYVGPLTVTITQSDDTNTFYIEDNKLILRNFNGLSATLTGVTSQKYYANGELVSSGPGISTTGYFNNLSFKDKQFTLVMNVASNGSVLTFPSLPSALVGVVSTASSQQQAGSRSLSRSTGVAIGDNAFSNTNLTTVTLPPLIASIGANIFENCPIQEIVFTGPPPPASAVDVTFYQQIPPNTVITVPPVYLTQVQEFFASSPVPVNVTIVPTDDPVCFLGDAPVLTPNGYQRIDSLRIGDTVMTADGRRAPIQAIKIMSCVASMNSNPYIIPRGVYGATQDLMISPRHRIATADGQMLEARALGLDQAKMRGTLTYYNLELPKWERDNMIVAGVEVESLAPVRRRVISAAAFKRLVQRSYGDNITPSVMAYLMRICRFLPSGEVEVPYIKQRM